MSARGQGAPWDGNGRVGRAQAPVRTTKIPRQIPEQAWYMHPAFAVAVGGVLPFGAVFIELFFILTSLWLHQARRAPSVFLLFFYPYSPPPPS